jgi:hypothetical protein
MKFKILFLIFGMTLTHQVFSQNNESKKSKNFNIEKGIAVGGYDPVSYFTAQKATKGKPSRTRKTNSSSVGFGPTFCNLCSINSYS